MPGAGRLGDKGKVQADAHACPKCPHTAVGPSILGSFDVNVNGRPALRQDDIGVHAACCGANMWTATKGSPDVNVNGKPFHRKDDDQKHCGGSGNLIEGSSDVIVNSGSGGGGGGALSSKQGYTFSQAANQGAAGGASQQAQDQQAPAAGALDQQQPAESNAVSPSTEALNEKPEQTAVIEFVVKDQNGKPVPDIHFKVTLDDGTVKEGRTDAEGKVRVLGLKPGQGKLSFPDLDSNDWKLQ